MTFLIENLCVTALAFHDRKLELILPCPGKLGATLLASCQTVDVCGTNMRDHDFGNEF